MVAQVEKRGFNFGLGKIIMLALVLLLILAALFLVEDWHQLWTIASAPDNVPIVAMIPSKPPWYFLGLQEMLVYFDPWISGVVMPSLLVIGLMAFPYVDSNPLGNGYYTLKQRRFEIGMFAWGFFMWIILIFIGTF